MGDGVGESRESCKDEVAAGTPSKEHSRDDEDEEGTRSEPYNCAFCRRGFPTAQALGGHMNVHRKQRQLGRSASAAAPSSTAAAVAVQGRSSSFFDAEQQYCSPVTTTAAGFAQTHASEMPSSKAAGESFLFHASAAEPVVAAEATKKELRLFVGRCDDRGKGAHQDDDVQQDFYQHSKDDGDQGEGEDLDLELRLGGAGSSS